MELARVRRGLARAMETARPRINSHPYFPESVTAPAAYVVPDTRTFDKAMSRGLDSIDLVVTVLVSAAAMESAQESLDAYLSGDGPASLKLAMEEARGAPGEFALEGACDDFHVTGWSEYGIRDHQGASFVGADISVTVYGKGDA